MRLRCLLLPLSLAIGLAWAPACVAEPEAIRQAKVAGQFYPDDREELRSLVRELLERQPAPARAQKPRILLVPHAGYQYSGLVAATAFRQLEGHTYDGVVVVGFTHRLSFPGSSADAREAYATPVGTFPVDREAVALLQSHAGVGYVEEAHESGEHSLEVELPFLQTVLPSARLVPVLMGTAGWTDAKRLADALAALSRRGDYLFVFSTDLSHYHPYDEAKRLDEETVNAILFETPQAVRRLFGEGRLEACGQGPILTSLLLAAKLGYPERELLYEANSGDTAGDPSRVVGYAALAMYDRPAAAAAGRLSPGAGSALVAAARQTLEQSLGPSTSAPRPASDSSRGGQDRVPSGVEGLGPSAPPSVALERYPELTRPSGLFVTLRKQGELRGCVGRLQTDEPLAQSVSGVALDAALRDHRFSPVTPEELPVLRVEVSILTPPTRLAALDELVAGRDGVMLEHEGRRGVFLPQVWEETAWTRLEFLRGLASEKAGLPPDAWQQADLYVFQDQIFEEPGPASSFDSPRQRLP